MFGWMDARQFYYKSRPTMYYTFSATCLSQLFNVYCIPGNQFLSTTPLCVIRAGPFYTLANSA